MVILLGREERFDPLREQRFFSEIELNDVAGDESRVLIIRGPTTRTSRGRVATHRIHHAGR